ncbi:uncharacterized protein LOC125947678 [Dermacentor silvarum]|uniref:uncharacterized protein LOC125947678 n=1 Tax=Dermacentor silvarum TaxID=543639 RepID=UPI002101407F|nr:uncharacterized protein LOC125947678 [Dermacentor silvarum]
MVHSSVIACPKAATMDIYILGGLKLATLVCTCLAGIELKNSGRPHSRKPTLYSLFDITYLVTCVGACAVLVMLVCHLIHIGSLWATWSPMLCFDLFVTCAFCAETVFMGVVFLTRRLRNQAAPWITCTVHGIILTTMVGDILEGNTSECTEQAWVRDNEDDDDKNKYSYNYNSYNGNKYYNDCNYNNDNSCNRQQPQ